MKLDALPELFYDPPHADCIWHQFDIGLVRFGGDARPSARALFGELVPHLDAGCAEGRVRGWFFMRKPPDVRLRVLLNGDDRQTRSQLVGALSGLLDARRLLQHARGRYRPETDRFGGESGLRLAHACFGVDARLWWALEQLDQQSRRRIDPVALAAGLIRQMFEILPGDGAIEAWRALADLTGPIAPGQVAPSPPPAPAQLFNDPRLDPDERAVLQVYAESQRRLVEELLAAEAELGRTPAQVLATVALFNLNRHGVTDQHSAPLAQSFAAAGGSAPA